MKKKEVIFGPTYVDMKWQIRGQDSQYQQQMINFFCLSRYMLSRIYVTKWTIFYLQTPLSELQ